MATSIQDLAALSSQVYEPRGGTPPLGWRVLADSTNYLLGGGNTQGFFGVVYVSPNGQRVFTYRGTELSELNDVSALLQTALAKRGPQFEIARQFYSAVNAQFGLSSQPAMHTGHSQGGAIASLIAAINGESAVTFNTIGVKDLLATYFLNSDGDYNVTNVRSKFDPAQNIGQVIGPTVTVLVSSFNGFPDIYEPVVPILCGAATPFLFRSIVGAVGSYYFKDQHSIDSLARKWGRSHF